MTVISVISDIQTVPVVAPIRKKSVIWTIF